MEHAKNCAHCQTRKEHEEAHEEFSFSVLLSLIPMLVFTLFGQMGLF